MNLGTLWRRPQPPPPEPEEEEEKKKNWEEPHPGWVYLLVPWSHAFKQALPKMDFTNLSRQGERV